MHENDRETHVPNKEEDVFADDPGGPFFRGRKRIAEDVRGLRNRGGRNRGLSGYRGGGSPPL